MITDYQYQGFMDALVADQRTKNKLNLPEWEGNFVASYIRASRKSLWFTAGRRLATDRMWMRWGPDLNLPHPADIVTERPKMAEADPTGCEFLVKGDDGRQQRCNEPAVCREPGHLRYCEAHRDQVERAMHFAKKTIVLIPFP